MSSRELESMLEALREQSRGLQAPQRVEVSLRSAFRARVARRRWQQAGFALAAGLVLVAGAAALWRMLQPVPVVAPAPRISLKTAPAAVVAAVQPVPQPAAVIRPVRRARRPRPISRQEEATTGFLPIDETLGLAPIESAQVVRVQLPRSTLIRFGLPVNQDRMLEPVNADVMFAQDGIARAIRFVK